MSRQTKYYPIDVCPWGEWVLTRTILRDQGRQRSESHMLKREDEHMWVNPMGFIHQGTRPTVWRPMEGRKAAKRAMEERFGAWGQ